MPVYICNAIYYFARLTPLRIVVTVCVNVTDYIFLLMFVGKEKHLLLKTLLDIRP